MDRSEIMRRIKSRDTKPERLVEEALSAVGLDEGMWRCHVGLEGKPDFAWPKAKVALFVNGCFWHRHTCKRGGTQPKSNADFWRRKFERNVARDASAMKALRGAGWSVFVIWECQLNGPHLAALLLAIYEETRDASSDHERDPAGDA